MSSNVLQDRPSVTADPINPVEAATANNAPPAIPHNNIPVGVTLTISIPRDLAVQIVGSDAGKMQRMKPQSSMTKDATPDEIAHAEEFMRPFLDHEIARVHDKEPRTMEHVGDATREQALAIKNYCIRYANHVKSHLTKNKNGDPRHRSEQRLDQARDVINQVNRGLGLPLVDDISLEELASEILSDAQRLCDKLSVYIERVGPSSSTKIMSQANAGELLDLFVSLDDLLLDLTPSSPSDGPEGD